MSRKTSQNTYLVFFTISGEPVPTAASDSHSRLTGVEHGSPSVSRLDVLRVLMCPMYAFLLNMAVKSDYLIFWQLEPV